MRRGGEFPTIPGGISPSGVAERRRFLIEKHICAHKVNLDALEHDVREKELARYAAASSNSMAVSAKEAEEIMQARVAEAVQAGEDHNRAEERLGEVVAELAEMRGEEERMEALMVNPYSVKTQVGSALTGVHGELYSLEQEKQKLGEQLIKTNEQLNAYPRHYQNPHKPLASR